MNTFIPDYNKSANFKSRDLLVQFARGININDVKKYIEEHHEDYLKFLKKEERKEKLSNKNKN